MKKLWIAGALALAATGVSAPAFAADMGPPPVHRAAVVECSWCGFYAGINLGGQWGRSETDFFPGQLWSQDPNANFFAGLGSPRINRNGFTGGGQIGMNSQWLGLVVGLEIDLEYIGLNVSRNGATFTGPFGGPLGGVGETVTFNETINNRWLSTQRVRLGWAATPAILLYATGGLALSRQEFTQTYSSPNFNGGALPPGFLAGVGATASEARLVGGWTVGGGLEFKFAPGWSLRGEYLYVDLGKVQATSTLAGAGPAGGLGGFTANHENHMWTNIARASINYQWGALPVLYAGK